MTTNEVPSRRSRRRRRAGGVEGVDFDEPEDERTMERGHSRMILLVFCVMWSILSVIASVIFAIFAANQRQANLILLSLLFACLISLQAGIVIYSERTQPLLAKAVTKGFGWLFRNPPRLAAFFWMLTTIGAVIVFGFLISALATHSAVGQLRTAGFITFILIGVGWLSITVGVLFSSVFRDVRLRVGDGWEELQEVGDSETIGRPTEDSGTRLQNNS
ncbi:hypothetical protein FOZ63_025724 [Perkinsus olseni]|uniref:Uncharacterized protein n=1 Tax=Perkinsus olseni TaxID=32597 RepID=A0A7J6S7Z5_PEROL|nr:hypothetical protein FOZ62_015633 [Perkinsus olseni]KAF4728150.1 hypothetical protein FOZ63_025724 [Perkinsus olseni]